MKVRRHLGQERLRREVGEKAPGWFWKQENNLLLKQPDWFALEGFCV